MMCLIETVSGHLAWRGSESFPSEGGVSAHLVGWLQEVTAGILSFSVMILCTRRNGVGVQFEGRTGADHPQPLCSVVSLGVCMSSLLAAMTEWKS